MGALTKANIKNIFHFSPLHYLPYILNSQSIQSKAKLRMAGFEPSHFRSTSRGQDARRGFEEYVHMTPENFPPILMAKLKKGFPHICISVVSAYIEQQNYHLCRYNIAKTRALRKNGKSGHQESLENGRYYGSKQIPIAVTEEDKAAMTTAAQKHNIMIEVLIPEELPLPKDLSIVCYSRNDAAIAEKIVSRFNLKYNVSETSPEIAPEIAYVPNSIYVAQVTEFVDRLMADPAWKGNGLEFDRV